MGFTNVTIRALLNRQLWIVLFSISFLCPVSSAVPNIPSNRSSANSERNKNRTKARLLNSTNDALLPRRLTEGTTEVILLNVSDIRWLNGDELDEKTNRFVVDHYVVTSRNPRIARILNSTLVAPNVDEFLKNSIRTADHESPLPTLEIDTVDEGGTSALSVKISGRRVGRTVIDISAYGYSKDPSSTQSPDSVTPAIANSSISDHQSKQLRFVTSFDVFVIRRSLYSRLNSAFTIFVAVITIATTFLIGTQLDWKIIIKELRKPASLVVGVGCEFILMPLVAFVLGLTLLRGNYGWQLACLAIGACPGGGHSPFWTMMLDGNLDLAVAMSFVASVAALGVLPMWLFTLGRVFYGGRVTIPYLTIMGSLFGLICPIVFGLAFKHYLPVWAERIRKILKPITLISFIVVGIFGCAVNSYVFSLLEWRHFVCGMLLPYAGFALTYPFARWVCRRSYADSLAISVENGCLSVAVPTVLIQLTLPQPDADLSLVVPVGIVICASWPLWIYFGYLVVKKRFMDKPKTVDTNEMPVHGKQNCDSTAEISHQNVGGVP